MSNQSTPDPYINTETNEKSLEKNETRKKSDEYETKRSRLKDKIHKNAGIILSCINLPFIDSFIALHKFTNFENRFYAAKDDYEKKKVFISDMCTKNVEIMESFLDQLKTNYNLIRLLICIMNIYIINL